MDSIVDNYTETVEYKLQVKIRDKQTNKVNEADKGDIFARIVNIHRLVNTLVGSEFITTMRKFPAVRHPIVKTNAIAKNRYYKKCHSLWNFLHTYSQVGVQVNLVKQDPVISKHFEKDIYDSFVWNYAMLHNYLEDVDILNIDREKVKKEMSVEDIRLMLEEIINGMHEMTDSSLRKLIQNEMVAIQTRRKLERRKAEKALKGRRRRKQ